LKPKTAGRLAPFKGFGNNTGIYARETNTALSGVGEF